MRNACQDTYLAHLVPKWQDVYSPNMAHNNDDTAYTVSRFHLTAHAPSLCPRVQSSTTMKAESCAASCDAVKPSLKRPRSYVQRRLEQRTSPWLAAQYFTW